MFTDEWYSKESMEERGVVQIPLCFLLCEIFGKYEFMSCSIFLQGLENAKRMPFEHDAAVAYGLDVIYEE